MVKHLKNTVFSIEWRQAVYNGVAVWGLQEHLASTRSESRSENRSIKGDPGWLCLRP